MTTNRFHVIKNKPEPDPEVIAVLKELLEKAESGELVSLYGVAEYVNGDYHDILLGPSDEDTMVGRLQRLALSLLLGEHHDEDE